LFVGTIGVGKGIPELLKAWERSNVAGELVLVGSVEPVLVPLVRKAVEKGRVRHVEFTSDVAEYYRTSDMFVFPTHTEGGPQATLEAGCCGLPVITTSMGASRLVKHEINGIVVPEGDSSRLCDAIIHFKQRGGSSEVF
jgi:glycosyltransferase involved in cell wall biosynthesis